MSSLLLSFVELLEAGVYLLGPGQRQDHIVFTGRDAELPPVDLPDMVCTYLRRHYLDVSSVGESATARSWWWALDCRNWGDREQNHYVRDMTWQEDQHQAWVGNGLHIMATLRNLTLGILRLNGIQKIKEATEG